MGRQADEKLPETEARRGVAPPSQHGFSEGAGARRGLFFPESTDGRLIHARG